MVTTMIKTILKAHIISLFLLVSSMAFADDVYFATDSGAGSQDGSSIANAWSFSAVFADGTHWSATEDNAKIDPGDTL